MLERRINIFLLRTYVRMALGKKERKNSPREGNVQIAIQMVAIGFPFEINKLSFG